MDDGDDLSKAFNDQITILLKKVLDETRQSYEVCIAETLQHVKTCEGRSKNSEK